MKFTIDENGLEQLLSSAGADVVLSSIAHDIANDWQRNDPRNQPGGHEPPTIDVGAPQREHGVSLVPVTTDDSIWHIIERGSVNNPPYRPATRAVQSSGLKFEEGE